MANGINDLAGTTQAWTLIQLAQDLRFSTIDLLVGEFHCDSSPMPSATSQSMVLHICPDSNQGAKNLEEVARHAGPWWQMVRSSVRCWTVSG
jgi:hypothetical protein